MKAIEIKDLQVTEIYPYDGAMRVQIAGETTVIDTFVAEGALEVGQRVKVLIVRE